MKKINSILLLFLLLLSMTITLGCSSTGQRNFSQRRNFQDTTEEERQQMIEERQKQAAGACEGKNEGDICQFESPMGNMEGACKMMDGNLACTIDRPMRQG